MAVPHKFLRKRTRLKSISKRSSEKEVFFMRSVIELFVSLTLIFGGSRYALIKAHDYFQEKAAQKIIKGLSSTQELNRMLWKGGK